MSTRGLGIGFDTIVTRCKISFHSYYSQLENSQSHETLYTIYSQQAHNFVSVGVAFQNYTRSAQCTVVNRVDYVIGCVSTRRSSIDVVGCTLESIIMCYNSVVIMEINCCFFYFHSKSCMSSVLQR